MKPSYISAGDFFNKRCDVEAIRIHSECVIETALNLTRDTILEEDVFIIAGFLHDIARKESKEVHHLIAVENLKLFLTEHPVYKKHYEEIRDCLVHHRRFENPQTIYAKVFQIAVMLTPYTNRWKEYEKRKHI